MRVPIPEEVAAEVLFRHAHTCCVCNEAGKAVQIHHIDDNNSNNDPVNLAVLCLADHDATQIKGGFGRKLSAREVSKYRDDWVSRVHQRKLEADKIAVGQIAGLSSLQPPALDAEWEQPSLQLLAAYIEGLPDVLKHAYAQARKLWESIVTRDMISGSRLVIDVLEQSWIHLSAWFSPHHFGDKSAAEYFSGYIAARYSWNYALQEPEADGSRGREVRIIYVAETLADIEEAVSETAVSLGEMYIEDFDKDSWLRRWLLAKR